MQRDLYVTKEPPSCENVKPGCTTIQSFFEEDAGAVIFRLSYDVDFLNLSNSMDAAVLIPGIMASRLVLPAAAGGAAEEVWPPTPLETQLGYKRIDKLMDTRVVAGDMIGRVLCFSFYDTIKQQLAELGYTKNGTARRLVEFPYDWRLDNFKTADMLAARLDQLGDADRIILIGHSMGGLIARLILESGAYDARPWFGRLDRFLALATPHLGAPLALARIFGLDSTLGITGADFRRLASNPAYPSGYQLIPAPGEQAVWELDSPNVAALDVYDPATASRLGLDPALVAQSKKMHAALAGARRPAHVRYFYFAGAGHQTVTRVNVAVVSGQPVDHAKSVVTRTPEAGDGTVPLYSALPAIGQREIVIQEHATVFDGKPFRHVFFRLMGGDAGPALETVEGTDGNELELSLDSPVQSVARPVELTLAVVDHSAGLPAREQAIQGTVVLEAVDDDGRLKLGMVRLTAVTYAGPPIGRLSLQLPAIEQPGLYRLRFDGTPQAPRVAPFAVSAA